MKALKFVTMASKLGMFLIFLTKFFVEEAWKKAAVVKIEY